MKKQVMDTISDLVSNFLYYDRKESETLPMGVIEKIIEEEGLDFLDEMVSKFKEELRAGLCLPDEHVWGKSK